MQIKRPGVDVRVNSEVGGRTEEECFAFFVVCACVDERFADVVEFSLCEAVRIVHEFVFGSQKFVVQVAGCFGQEFVRRKHCFVYVNLCHRSHFSFFGGQRSAPTAVVIIIARCQTECSHSAEGYECCFFEITFKHFGSILNRYIICFIGRIPDKPRPMIRKARCCIGF